MISMTIKRAILIHGMNDPKQGTGNIDNLIPYLEALGYKVLQLDYGWRGLLGVRFLNWWTARRLVKIAVKTDVIIAYSNGVSINALACERGLKAEHYIWIHGALNPEWEPPASSPVSRIDVYFSAQDWTTALAEVLRKFSPLNVLGKTNWGYIGTVGSKSDNVVFINHEDDQSDHFNWSDNPMKYVEVLE
jgi:hypothetical protein